MLLDNIEELKKCKIKELNYFLRIADDELDSAKILLKSKNEKIVKSGKTWTRKMKSYKKLVNQALTEKRSKKK